MESCNSPGRSTRADARAAGASIGAVTAALVVTGNPQVRVCSGWPSEGCRDGGAADL